MRIPGTHELAKHHTSQQHDRADEPYTAPSFPEGAIAQLQHLIGNQALQRLMRQSELQIRGSALDVQRQANGPIDADAALDELLAEIANQPSRPELPSWEAISATTGAEFSTGELEQEIGRLWQREKLSFTGAAKKAARENTVGERGPMATESQHMAPEGGFALRWAISLTAADYQHGSDLPQINKLMKRGSPFRSALEGEFQNVIHANNPTAGDIWSQVIEAAMQMHGTMERGQAGELLVFFSGHGVNGYILGVDGEALSPRQLKDLAEKADELYDVRVVYVLDTCRGGLLANFAQAGAVTKTLQEVKGLPEDQQAPFDVQKKALEALIITHISNINGSAIEIGDQMRALKKHKTDENHRKLMDEISLLGKRLDALKEDLAGEVLNQVDVPDRAALQAQIDKMAMPLLWANVGKQSYIVELLRELARLLDILNDSVNIMIVQFDEQVKAAKASQSQ